MVISTPALTRTSWTELERLLQEAARGFGCPRGYAKEFARIAAWSECIVPGFLQKNLPDKWLFSDLSVPPLHDLELGNERTLVIVNRSPGFWCRFGPGLVDVATARRATTPKTRLIVFGDTDIDAFWYSLSRLRAKGFGATALIDGYADRFAGTSDSSPGYKMQVFVEKKVDGSAWSRAVTEARAVMESARRFVRVDESSQVISVFIDGSEESREVDIWIDNSDEDGNGGTMSFRFDHGAVDRRLAEASDVGFRIEVSELQAVQEAAHAFLVNDGEESRNNAG